MTDGVGFDTLTMRWYVSSSFFPRGFMKFSFVTVKRRAIVTGAMMGFYNGGFYKPAIHRVVQPPHDQSTYNALGAFYFTVADDDVILFPLSHSPMLKCAGIEQRCPDEEAPLVAAWGKNRLTSYGRVVLNKGSQNNIEEEVVGGIVVKHYN